MSLLEWLLLGLILALGAAACVVVERMRRNGEHVPGSL